MKKLLSVALVSLAPLAFAQDTLKVGDVTAVRGTKGTGAIHIPDGVDKGLDIPVSVVHGREPGKILALIAGTHGYEYTSILALQRLLPELDPAKMKGSVILVHMANPETFFGRRIYTHPTGRTSTASTRARRTARSANGSPRRSRGKSSTRPRTSSTCIRVTATNRCFPTPTG